MMNVKFLEGHQQIMPYLIFKDAAGFIDFALNILGGKKRTRAIRDEKNIMHAELEFGTSIIMCADATDEWKATPSGVFIYVADVDETYQKAIKAGAKSVMEPIRPGYIKRNAGILDNWENTWWLGGL